MANEKCIGESAPFGIIAIAAVFFLVIVLVIALSIKQSNTNHDRCSKVCVSVSTLEQQSCLARCIQQFPEK